MEYTLPKQKKLFGEIRVANVFHSGKSCISYPIRACFIQHEKLNNEPVRILVSVPKRLFKRAVKRNRLKRLMRESYRLNQQPILDFCAQNKVEFEIAFSYIADEEKDFQAIQEAMIKILEKIINR